MALKRKFPIGAEVVKSGVHFRVWAPKCKNVELVLEGKEKDAFALEKEPENYFSVLAKGVKEGARYHFRVDQETQLLPDPASRFQPEGPHGPSCVIASFDDTLKASDWKGIMTLKGHVIYELHVGTFTQEGSWSAAIKKLPDLKELGITIIEMLPIADFHGAFGWGYDGVNLFAPTRLYGTPFDLREFIYQAHQLGIGVILDVVYNHFGSEGNYLSYFSDDYLSEIYKTDWGSSINFEHKNSKHVREFFITNALYWIEEYGFDGLRLDATQNIIDHSEPHILAEIAQVIHAHVKEREVVLIAENESQEIKHVLPSTCGGYGLDAVWNDDFHHSAQVCLTGRGEAYCTNYYGSMQELISSIKYGYLYQGQYYSWLKKNRGTASLRVPSDKFVIYLQNHDQIANSTRGFRLHQLADIHLVRAMTTLLLLAPGVPLIFQGQEFACDAPFYFFADHSDSLKKIVWEGRKKLISQFPSTLTSEMQAYYPDPCDINSFLKSKMRWEEKTQDGHREMFLFHRDLLKLRQADSVFTASPKIDGASIANDLLLLRYFGPDDDDRMILCNFGMDYRRSIPDPLFAPPTGKKWHKIFHSQHPLYGGVGIPPDADPDKEWSVPGHTAIVYKSLKLSS